jgi:predicted permease
MAYLILLVLPIFLVIFLGKILQLTLVKSADVWDGISKISYWVLFPAFLFFEMAKIDLGSPAIFTYSLSLIMGFFAATTFAYVVGRLTKENNSALTSVIQGAGRHNTFIGLAVAGQLFGGTGATIGTLATAALVPLSNVVAVVMMAFMLNNQAGKRRTIQDIVRNPIILSIAAGLIFNTFDLDREFVVYQFSELLGRATLPTLLLVIGANLRFAGVKPHVLPSLISITAKMLVFPAVTLLGSDNFGLSPEMTVIAVIFAACPTSTAAFPLAKQMGGDAPLMATIISIQTALAVIAIPIAILLAQAVT